MRGRPPPCTCWTAGEESRGALYVRRFVVTEVDFSTQALVVEQRWRGGLASALAGKGMQNVVTVNDYLKRRDGGGGGGGTTSYTTLCVKVPSDFQLDYSDSEAFFFLQLKKML